ncbi:MAG: hypothetical protein Q9162_001137 [Coniocarpon cinnabarinum]
MSTTGQDICRQLYEAIPAWLSTLSLFTEDPTRRRKSSIVDQLATPELSTHVSTTVGSTSESATAGSVPGVSRRAEGPGQNATQVADHRLSLQQVEVSRSRGSSTSSKVKVTIFYDSSGQEKLADTVKGIDRLIYHIKKSGLRKALEGVSRSLMKASSTCEDAAFQLLKSGGCRREAQHASTILQHLYDIARREVMEDRLVERLSRRDSAIVQDNNSHCNSDISAPIKPSIKPPDASIKRQSVPLMPQLMVDEMDIENDDEQLEVSLPNLRLTSRMAR